MLLPEPVNGITYEMSWMPLESRFIRIGELNEQGMKHAAFVDTENVVAVTPQANSSPLSI